MRGLAFVALALVLVLDTAGAAQPIGRLFFTPAERAQLDVARATKRTAEPAGSQKSAEPPPPETRIITYNGIVRRSDGKSTLWLNNRVAPEKEALSNLPVTGRVRPDGRVTLQAPDGGGTIDLKVGQRAELTTGRVSEAPPPEKARAPDKGAKDARDEKGEAAKAADKDSGKSDAKAPPKAGEPEKRAEPSKAPEAEQRSARVPAK
ncbi:MAG TPA: hypothetical protein VHP37_05160 [Burkholderiales bacterium]|nr:hypothetical protein [Burkholderiales bacterium]